MRPSLPTQINPLGSIRQLLFVAAIVILTGCTNLSSVKTLGCNAENGNCVGVTYYLPKRSAVLSIKRGKETFTKKNGERVFTGRCLDTIRVDLQPTEPDLEHQYTAQLKHLIVSNDVVNVNVNARGLLDSRDNLNQTPGAELQKVLSQLVEVDDESCQPNDFAVVFNPTETAMTALPDPYDDYRVKVYARTDNGVQRAPAEERVGGLVYRRSRPYIFTFEQCADGDCAVRQAAQALLPNEGSVAVLPYRNSAFAKTRYKVQFRDGELVGWDANRPAEVIEIIKIPLDLLQTVVSVPMRILGATQ